jgi:N-acetylmuramoyl-L-alanine amidase
VAFIGNINNIFKKCNKMIVLIDAGHGSTSEERGKYSPLLKGSGLDIPSEFTNNGRFREWKYNRVIANQVVDTLVGMGYDARLVTPEDKDISLSERIRRINTICNKEGAGNVLLISVHSNAVGNGTQWMNAYGWEAYTTRGETKSDVLAEYLYKRADTNIKGRKIREDWTDGDRDKEADFYIIKKAKCPAVLTENFFYDNKDDLLYLTSDEGVHGVVRLHVEGIIDYIKNKK